VANLSYCPALNYARLDLQGCAWTACANAVRRVLTECSCRGVRFAEVVFGKDHGVLQPVVESALLQEPLYSCIEDSQPVLLIDGRVSIAPNPQDATALLLRLRRIEGATGDYLRGFRYGRGQRVNAVKLKESSLEPEIESGLLIDLIAHL
jgi:Smr domain-containing protein